MDEHKELFLFVLQFLNRENLSNGLDILLKVSNTMGKQTVQIQALQAQLDAVKNERDLYKSHINDYKNHMLSCKTELENVHRVVDGYHREIISVLNKTPYCVSSAPTTTQKQGILYKNLFGPFSQGASNM